MFNDDMYKLGSKRSVIRELYEYGKTRALNEGDENVFDFSLGNPNVPSPDCVSESLLKIANDKDVLSVHGYTSAQGDISTRRAIKAHICKRYGAACDENLIYMTCGAAASLCITLRALNECNDEFVIITPYFPEYRVFIDAAGGTPIIANCDENFSINFASLENAITPKTKAVIVNSPNNPSGIVYDEDTVLKLAELLRKKSAEYQKPIFLVSDEPYREIVYEREAPYIASLYENTIVCYSYSKSLSIPGERIGYIAVNPQAANANSLYLAICGAGRALGYVCAPATYQRVVQACASALPNVDKYRRNRDILYRGLTEIGYACNLPDGAFYMLVKSLESDAKAFSEKAKRHGLLLVPCEDFGLKGYVRLAYCVEESTIIRSLPFFKKLFDEFNPATI